MRLLLLTGVLVALSPLAGRSEEKKRETKDVDLPVKAKLVAKKTTYTLDLGGKTGEEVRQLLKDAEKTGVMPAPPAVDLEVEITNTGDKEIKIWDRGDPVQVYLTLTGPGAVNAKPMLSFTADIRAPVAVNLAPGKTLSIPVTKLMCGFRGVSNLSYWTEPGDYKLSASYTTGISPAPTGIKPQADGFGRVTVGTEPVAIKVVPAK